MNLKKESLKEIPNATSVDELVVFERGSSLPKRVKRNVYNSNLGYRLYVAQLTQTGTNPPEATIIHNDFDEIPIYTYLQTGNYTVDLFNGFPLNLTFATINQSNDVGSFPIVYTWQSGSAILIQSTVAGVDQDDILYKHIIKIEVY